MVQRHVDRNCGAKGCVGGDKISHKLVRHAASPPPNLKSGADLGVDCRPAVKKEAGVPCYACVFLIHPPLPWSAYEV